jgi:uncharacterized protein
VRLTALLFLFLTFIAQGADIQIPVLNSPVMDEANLLSESDRQDLSQLAYEIYTHQGPQITILTVNDLQGNAIEEFSIRVAEKWKLGTKEKGNGLLILITKTERQMRIEVGEGLEGDITDYESNQYINQVLKPYFKQGQFHDGLRIVLQDIAKKFGIQLSQSKSYIRRAPRNQVKIPDAMAKALPFIIIALLIIQFVFLNKPGLRGVLTGSIVAGAGALIGAQIFLIIILFLFGLFFGFIGLHNILYQLGTGHGGHGGFGGSGSGGGGSWGGGGGGFSGGGSSGNW